MKQSYFLLNKGETGYRNTEVVFNNLEYGLSDYVNVGAAVSTIFYINTIGTKLKIGTSLTPLVHVAVGGQFLYTFGADTDPGSFTVFYGAFTLGTTDNHLTMALQKWKDPDENHLSVFSLAGAVRLGPKASFFVEYNRMNDVDYNDTIFMLNSGARWTKGQNRIDFGFMIAGDEDFIFPFPIAAFSHYF